MSQKDQKIQRLEISLDCFWEQENENDDILFMGSHLDVDEDVETE